jgi:UDP-4-amino-4,6-dideoxy-L-N-acetyl-beta-L-altrosamine transaminase
MIPYSKQFIDSEDKKSVLEVLESDFLTTGPKVKEFEDALCEYTGAKYAVAVSSGTAALHLSSLILLNKGDLVLTTPNSFVATSNSILYAGAIPLFVDIKEDGNIDLNKCIEIINKFGSRIKAIFLVHFSGNPVDMEKLAFIREKYPYIKILEDSAHAIGAKYKCKMDNGEWKINKIGDCRFSDITTFSFHPVKNITTGEGGAILTNDGKIYKKALILRNHGIVCYLIICFKFKFKLIMGVFGTIAQLVRVHP